MFSFHLVEQAPTATLRRFARPPDPERTPGLRHAECMSLMRLGAPVVSPDRLQLGRMAMFARWEHEVALDDFLAVPEGAALANGWHVRLQFLRRWSEIEALPGLPVKADDWAMDEPVVAVTLARMRLPEVPRFLRWGRPVERQVRDHPATTLALAAMRPPRTISTFSVWRSVREMTGMVHGRDPVDERHSGAMIERSRRDFHREFATYRFRPLSEHGTWEGRTAIVPTTD